MRRDVAQSIRERVTMRDVLNTYGIETARNGFLHCPFHPEDHTPSLKVYPDGRGWHCFGCGRGGSVIDFVMSLFSLPFSAALIRMDHDFGLGLIGAPSKAAQDSALDQRRKEAAALAEYRREYDQKCREAGEIRAAVKEPAPAGNHALAAFQGELLGRLAMLDYWFSVNHWR